MHTVGPLLSWENFLTIATLLGKIGFQGSVRNPGAQFEKLSHDFPDLSFPLGPNPVLSSLAFWA